MMLVFASHRAAWLARFSEPQTCSTIAGIRWSMAFLVMPRPTAMTVPRSREGSGGEGAAVHARQVPRRGGELQAAAGRGVLDRVVVDRLGDHRADRDVVGLGGDVE